jgi:uroporphyrinogen decarboxylase
MPQYLDWPVKSREDWEEVKARFDPDEPRRYPPSWSDKAIEYYKTVDHSVCMNMGGFYALGRLLMGTKNFPYWFYKDPELMHDMMSHHADFLIGATREACEALKGKIDWVWWHEDMAHRHGPNISPKIFKEFMLPYYKKVSSHFNHYNIRNLCMDCDGDARLLMPLWWEGGIRGIVPLECTPGSKQAERFPTPASFQDIRKMRKEFPKWFLACNIDKRALEKGKEAIRNEVEYKVTFMKEGRGMIPSVDHHVPPSVSFENYKHYLENLKKAIFA